MSEIETLQGRVAVVTGASRGVGKGVVLGLLEAGATVYATGRTITADTFGHPRAIPVVCDHTIDAQAQAVFERVQNEQPRLDLLVNNAWGGYERMVEDGNYTWELPFWEQPLWRWDAMIAGGVRAAYVASQYAARRMVAQGSGLIVNISFWAAQKYMGNVVYGIAKAATDKMTLDMAHELRPHHVAALALYPGLVRTEKVMESAAWFDLSNSESPQFIGRAVAALAADPNIMEKTGQVLVAAALAAEYNFRDTDGKLPSPLTREQA